MGIKVHIDGKELELVNQQFPGGESCIRIVDDGRSWPICVDAIVTLSFQGNKDLFDLALVVDALRRYFHKGVLYEFRIFLSMPYLPYARQDRVCNVGESLSVKVVADFINSLEFTGVYCYDIHSSVGVALIDNLIHSDLTQCAGNIVKYAPIGNTTLVSPDAGAEKKVFDLAKHLGYDSVVRATKVRDVATGKIVKTTLIDKIENPYGTGCCERLLIVDDIVDGGRTFVELAKALKADLSYSDQSIELYVTHGIFSAGMEVFEGLIDTIYVVNLMREEFKDHPLIQLI